MFVVFVLFFEGGRDYTVQAEIVDTQHHTWLFCLGSGDPDPDPQACAGGIYPLSQLSSERRDLGFLGQGLIL